MYTYGGRASRSPVGHGTIVVVLLMLWSIGCTTVSAPEVCTACTQPVPTAPAVASSASQPTAAPRPPTRPPPTGTAPLPTFALYAQTATLGPAAFLQLGVTATLDPKMAFRVSLNWALGPTDRQTTKVRDISYGRYEPGDIVVEWWINKWWSDDPPDPLSLRWAAQRDASTILWSIGSDHFDYTSAVLHGYLLSGTVQRNSDQAVLMVSLTYYKSTVGKIDFDGDPYPLSDRIFELADQSFIAPELR